MLQICFFFVLMLTITQALFYHMCMCLGITMPLDSESTMGWQVRCLYKLFATKLKVHCVHCGQECIRTNLCALVVDESCSVVYISSTFVFVYYNIVISETSFTFILIFMLNNSWWKFNLTCNSSLLLSTNSGRLTPNHFVGGNFRVDNYREYVSEATYLNYYD